LLELSGEPPNRWPYAKLARLAGDSTNFSNRCTVVGIGLNLIGLGQSVAVVGLRASSGQVTKAEGDSFARFSLGVI